MVADSLRGGYLGEVFCFQRGTMGVLDAGALEEADRAIRVEDAFPGETTGARISVRPIIVVGKSREILEMGMEFPWAVLLQRRLNRDIADKRMVF